MDTETVNTEAAQDNGADGGDNGQEAPASWLSSVPENLRDNEILKGHKNIGETLQSYIDLKVKSKDMIRLPKEGATEEELTAYKQALGIPEKADGYEIARPEKLPEGMVYDEALEHKFKEFAHSKNLPPDTVKAVADFYNKYGMEMYEGINKIISENRDKSVNTLKDIWKGDSYEENRKKATKTFESSLKSLEIPKELGGVEGMMKAFAESGGGDHPAIIWYFSKLYEKIGNDSFIKGEPSVRAEGQKGMLDFSKSKMPVR